MSSFIALFAASVTANLACLGSSCYGYCLALGMEMVLTGRIRDCEKIWSEERGDSDLQLLLVLVGHLAPHLRMGSIHRHPCAQID